MFSVSGLVVKFVVAIDEPGVRFPPDANHLSSRLLYNFFHFFPPLFPFFFSFFYSTDCAK